MPLSSAEPFFNVHTLDMSSVVRPVKSADGKRFSGRGRRKCGQCWTDSNWWMMDKKDDSHPKFESKGKKKKNERKNEILLLPTVWKGDLSKNTSTPQSLITLGLHARIYIIALKSLNWRYRWFVAAHQLRVSLRINQMWTDAFIWRRDVFL